MAQGIWDSEAYWFVNKYSGAGNLLDETANNHDSDAITNALHYDLGAANHLRIPGTDGSYFLAAYDASLGGGADIDIRVDIEAVDASNGTFQMLYSRLNWGSNIDFELRLDATGIFQLVIATGDTASDGASSTVTWESVVANGSRGQVRAAYDESAGTCDFYYRTDGDITSHTGWSALGTQVTGLTTAHVVVGSPPIAIGVRAGGETLAFAGKIYRTWWSHTLGSGSALVDTNADDWDDGDIQANSYVSGGSDAQTFVRQGTTAELARLVDRSHMWHDTDALISIPDAAALDFDESDSFTYGIGFRTYDTSPGADAVLMAKKTDLTTGDGYAGYLESADATAKGVLGDGANTQTATSGNLTNGKAHTLIWVYDGSTTQTYLDGSSSGSASSDNIAADMANASKLTFGSISGGGSYGQFEWWAACVIPLELSASEVGTGVGTLHDALLNQEVRATVTPSVITTITAMQTVTSFADISPSVSVIATTIAMQTVTAFADLSPSVSAIATTTAFGSATITYGGLVTASAIVTSSSFGTAAAVEISIVSPSVIATTTTFGTAAADTITTVTASVIATTISVGTASAISSFTVTPTVIATTISMGTHNAREFFETINEWDVEASYEVEWDVEASYEAEWDVEQEGA